MNDHMGLVPQWPNAVNPQRVGAWMSTRAGGVSHAPYDHLNLGVAVGDDPQSVEENRRRFARMLCVQPVFLRQVHGTTVLRLTAADVEWASRVDAVPPEADACVTTQAGIACTVQVADCLPVLFAAPDGRAVGAAHAGWRGLATGVLQATIAQLIVLADCKPCDLCAWLGPCIGPRQFEVGADVLQGFGQDPQALSWRHFVPRPSSPSSTPPTKWWADLPGLARQVLNESGVHHITGGQWCTVEDPSRFFSFRRDRVTGRMAAAVWIR